MDIRQLAPLASQPAAALKNRELFLGMPKRGLAFLLANVMFWQPMWAQADGIVVANPNTSLDRAGNGVPIINIATPNASGLSHNQFHDYNVGAQGVILNNGAAQSSNTQLGGHVIGNPNLKNSGSAQAILNEVISGNPSQLRGYTEVAGQSARVIVANPYGISCNGCGFINTPRVTLTTGKPVLDNGRLDRFQVDQGSVAIEGAGLNATNVDRFEIITRSAKINAQLQAQNLTIVAGRNDVNAQTLNATARADDGSAKPQLAIDSSALGGMYAGAIKLVGTEAGVGVKLDGKLIASGGDIQLDANGQLSLVDTSATGAVNVKAASLDARGPVYAGTALNVQTQGNLTNRQTLAARDSLILSAGGQLTNAGTIEAGVNADGSRNASGDLSLTAQHLDNTGKSLTASRNLTVSTAQTLNNQGGTLSGQNITITGGKLDNRSGQILGDLGLNIDLGGALDNRDGVLGSGRSLTLKAASLDNREAGALVSDGGLTARISGTLDNRNKGDTSAKGAIDLQAGTLLNSDGKVIGKSTLAVRSDVVDNRGGLIQADQQLTLNVAQLDNREKGVISGKAGLTYVGTRLDNSGGLVSAVGPVNLTAEEIQNTAGRISSQGDLLATIGLLQQQGGALVAQGNLSLTGKTLDNRNGGLVGTTKALTLSVDDVDNRSGEISSSLLMNVKGLRLDNGDGGKILSGSNLGLSVAKLINQSKGLIAAAKGAVTVTGTTLDNSGGNLSSLNGLVITLDDALINSLGAISSDGTLTVNAARIDNSNGSLGSAGNLKLTSTGVLLNQAGSINSDSLLTVNSGSLDNSRKGVIYGQGSSRVETGGFDNSQGGKLTSGAALTLKAGQVINATGRIASQQALDVSLTGLDQQGGELFSKTDLTLDLNHGQLNNQSGLINAPGTLLLKNLNGVSNQGGEISSQQAFTLAAHDLDNSNGKLLSQQGLTLRIAAALNNLNGVISATSLDSHSGSLDNHEGLISSRGELLLTTDKTLDNQLGTVIADGQLTVSADELDNREGNITGKADASVQAKTVNNQKGQLIAIGVLKIEGDQLDNRQNGLLGSSEDMTLTVADLDNRGGEISSKGDLRVTGNKLDNSDGGKVFTGTALTLTVDEVLNRTKGLLDAGSQFDLQGRSLDNNGGQLLSQQGMLLHLTGAFDNTSGKVSSEGTLTVNNAKLTNVKGSLSSAADLTLDSEASVDNQGGQIVTDGVLVLNSTSLDNRQQGTLSGKGAVTVTTGAFDNSNGRLSSADTLNLTAGQVTNSGDGSIGSQNALTASVSGLDQQGGKLFSNTLLSLDLNHGQLNNIGGLINAPGTLLLKQLNGVNNQGGTISSAEALTLTAQSLDNSNGKLLSNQGLTLRIAAALDNVKGMIGAATIDAHAASLNNSSGNLVSRDNLGLSVDGLLRNDGHGLISAAQTLEITSADLNNRDGGLINSQGNLTLNASGLNSSDGGEVSASGDIDLNLTSLTQNGGRLVGDKGVTLDLANGVLDNQRGVLTAQGPLTLKRLREVNNQSGEISSNLGFELIARAVNNSSGKIISGEKLLLRGTELVNQKGLISGWQGLTVNADSLDNRNSGTLSSKFADVSVDLKDALLNSDAGAVVAQGNLVVKAGSLDNRNKGNLSSGAGQILTLGGALNNSQGLIFSGAALDLVSTAFTNAGGSINAEQAFTATATRLDNNGGQIASNAAINLNLSGELNNNAGKLASSGAMLIKGVSDLRNQNGQIASQKTLEAHTDSLDNSNKGTVAANDQLQITATGAVNNSADGLIYSQKAGVQLNAASLRNGKGSIQSEGALTLEVSGEFDNQSGKVIAQNGNVFVTAANIDNRGGTLSSIKGALEARTVGVLRNGFDLNNNRQGGIIQAQSLTLTALAGMNNNGGRISAQSADSSITTAALDNSSGVLYSKGLLGVTGTSLENAGGQIAANRIDFGLSGALRNGTGVIESDTQLSVKAASVDNQNGRLRSLGNTGKTLFQIGGVLDNRNGVLETANVDMTLAVGGLLNAGGQLNHVGRGKFDISTANVIGAGGSIVTGGLLELNADSWSNSNVIQAGRLNVNVGQFSQTASGKLLASDSLQIRGGNWTNDGLIASDGILDMQIGGTYAGSGRLTSQRGAYLSVAQMNVAAAGSFAVGATSTVNIGGQLSNAGRMTSSEDLTINAGSVANYGTLGAAQNLIINTPSLLNDRGLIFSGNNMTLGVSTLTNQHGDFYGLGDVVMGGYGGAARAAGVYNISGSMESGRGFTLSADVFENRTEGPTASVERKLVSGLIAASCGDCVGGTFNNFLATRETYQFFDTDTSASAMFNVGKDFTFTGGTFLNSKSTVAAGGNITITADSLKNIGAKSGTVEVTRQYNFEMGTGTTAQFMANVILPYNQRNNPDFPFVYYVIAPEGLIRKAIAKTVGNGIVIVDAETGENVGSRKYGRAMSGYTAGFETSTPSLYDPNNLMAIPSELAPFEKGLAVEKPVNSTGAADTTNSRNAVIQAGGNVSITATREVENSVIHQDYSSTGGTNKVANTSVGNSGTVVVRINSQLPPDLAQQQVNPLSLPGFSLPTGENGLFRLSGQGSSGVTAGNIGPAPTWTVGSESVNAQDHMVAASSGGPRNLFIDAPAQVSDSTRIVDTFHRTPSMVQAVASNVDAKVPESSVGTGKPGRGNDIKESIDTRPVTRVTGLPDTTAPSNPHKYLIETNPVLTDLKSFMSSDYLLEKLGYNPDQSAKRLGDGLYEQRLIQQAVTARTGQAFLDGQTSNEGMFKYLMNNAIASKDALNLSVGVGLTSQQVAALTHDIVWLEEHEVNGEKVLVPVVYLAQANGRLGPTGALIAGNDVTLIAGENLDNVGTLKATNNLSATAGKDLVNSGSIEAGNRLDLLATNNIVNKAGGIIAGKDVSLTTRTGDVINERTITSMDDQYGTVTRHQDFADNAARIEAANDLTVNAAKDINVIGGVLKSGQDMALNAGRDVNVASVQVNDSASLGWRGAVSSVTQLGADIDAGRDFKADAKRDISVIASEIDAKRNVSMSATENLVISSAADEEHSRSANKKMSRQDDQVRQVMSGITAGGDMTLNAGKDLELIASRVSAGDEAYLFAGNNVNLETADNLDHSYYSKTKKGSFGKKKSTMSESESAVSVSSVVQAGNKLAISAGEDFNATGAKLKSDGTLLATAGHDINLDAAEDYASTASASSKKGWTSSKSSSSKVTESRLNSTELVAKNIELKADHDISLAAAALRAKEEIKLTAANDILVGASEETKTTAQSKSSSKTSANLTGYLTSAQKSQERQTTSTRMVGSDISGGSIQIKSGRDTVVEGSTLVADKNIGIDAGRNLEIISAENTESSSAKSGSKKVGEIGSWWQGATGVIKQKEGEKYDSTRQSGSQIASLGGNVSLTAGDHYTQSASQLVTPLGDVSITAKHVDIEAGFDTLNSSRTASTSRTAIGGSVSIPLLDALRGIQQMGEAAQKTSDDRMVALAAVNAAMSANQAVDAGKALMNSPNAGIKISVNLSDSRSHSESSQSGRNVVGSDVVAGGNVKIVATGDGANSDINVIGSRIEGGGDVSLKADGEINLLSAQNTAHQESTNSNSGWSAGIGIGFGGAQNGVSFELAANAGRGMADGDDVTHTNTYIKGGNSVKLESGGDTNIKGGVVSADQVKVNVGGDLNIESQQDTSTYTSKQLSANIGVNICVPPICAGMSTISGGIAAQNMNSEYASVSEQSGIKAGNGGFQVEVKGNTDLVGAVIASTDKAVADGKNTLSTGTLTTSDIKNKAEYDATSINLSGGYGGSIGRDGNGNASATANPNGPKVPNKGGVSMSTPVVLYAGDSSSSTTHSGISGAAVTITNGTKQQELTGQTAEQAIAAINTDVSSERDGSNKLKPIFDAQEIGVDFEIVGKFVQNVSQYIDSRAREIDQKKEQANAEKAAADNESLSLSDRIAHHENYLQLNQQIKEIGDNWGAGGTYRQIATALVAGISGNVAGSGAQFAQNMVVNYVQQQGSAYIGDLVKKGLKEGSPEHAALHAILGCAGAAASSQSCAAGALGGSAASLLAGLFADADPNETAESREAKRNIITSIVTGIAAMSTPNGAATANNAAAANVDNNWLATQQYVQAKKEIDAEPNVLKKLAIIEKWGVTSLRQDLLTTAGVMKGFTDGMAGAGLGTLDSAVMLMRDPMKSWEAIEEFAGSDEAQALLGKAVADAFKSQIDQIKQATVEGGDANAENLGRQMGQSVALVIQLLIGGGSSSANSALILSRMGIDVSVNTVKKIGASFDLDVVKTQITKLPSVVRDTDVPIIDPVKPVTPPKTDVTPPKVDTTVPKDGDLPPKDGVKPSEVEPPPPEKVPDEFIPPGMDRPFRPVNPEHPPIQSVVDAMESPLIKKMVACDSVDCSEIAIKLFDAAEGKGKIIEVRPVQSGKLTLFENGKIEADQIYHQVYTDGRYVYDPRLSSNPIPKGDWEQHIKGMNPEGVKISDNLKGL
ncbi:hemagglutinin repeat-containing protein [Pseudomonas sp. rhizo66]|uniref:hemagglutinin repeat-containing protein n=1 Tax=Pseudomonas sp. rhizo66 TaxID=3059674 RepID=UPI00288C88C7|nr:hemagglutinin repeat-containing protein [Pseudomonas sp. rhizo66]MDT3312751.1 hemagglutinin repeat-containing protein [Pseudomonas sp. rhizo66]